jgi:hypothetical protein
MELLGNGDWLSYYYRIPRVSQICNEMPASGFKKDHLQENVHNAQLMAAKHYMRAKHLAD